MEDFIDFGSDEPLKTEIITMPSTQHPVKIAATPLYFNTCSSFEEPVHGRESFDNNPFDGAQKLVNRPLDPFDTLEKEASLKARCAFKPQCDVKLANLLSLSDDNILDDNLQNTPAEITTQKFNSEAIPLNTLENESPPVFVSLNSTPESATSSAPGSAGFNDIASSTEGSGSSTGAVKMKKTLEFRKRLLKLSISNSTFNSPVSRHMPLINVTGFNEEGNTSSAISAILQDITNSGENMIVSESPLKMVEDEDLIANEPPSFVDSEKDFDAELAMLKIPILKELTSPMIEQPSELTTESMPIKEEKTTNETSELQNLETIRARLQAERQKATNKQDITLLIQNLKSLIFDTVGRQKKEEVSTLLETLSSALAVDDKKQEKTTATQRLEPENCATYQTVPQVIVRQGTFDMELEENKKKEEHFYNNGAATNDVEHLPTTEVMMRSSATYDGETAEERGDIQLPEILLTTSPLPQEEPKYDQPDINHIMDQLSKYIGQHQMSQQICSDSSDIGPTNLNPTFIVVMNTTQTPSTNSYNTSVSNLCDDSPDMQDFSAVSDSRRRSQSLSIHDKIKFLQLPLQPSAYIEADKTPPSIAIPPDANQFKTPSRPMRRNSFSNCTPYTPMMASNFGNKALSKRRTNCGVETLVKGPRRSTVLTTHHERQPQEQTQHGNNIHPMPMNAFKLDFKKKCRSSIAKESVMKSSMPLKATIPVKTVAPQSKLSSSGLHKGSLNTSMHLMKSGKMSHASTLMPQSNKTGGTTCIPNACSTPTTRSTSPIRRRMNNTITKPRYSYLPTSPVPKSTLTPSATAVLKRRSLSELKAKSPIKSRLNSIGSATTLNAAKASTSKTSTRLAPPTAASTSRLGTRDSFGGTGFTYKNKENKQP